MKKARPTRLAFFMEGVQKTFLGRHRLLSLKCHVDKGEIIETIKLMLKFHGDN